MANNSLDYYKRLLEEEQRRRERAELEQQEEKQRREEAEEVGREADRIAALSLPQIVTDFLEGCHSLYRQIKPVVDLPPCCAS